MAIDEALAYVRETGNLPVPLHLRNAPTKLMKQLDYGKEYKYAHNYPGHFVRQQYLPDEAIGRQFWHPQQSPPEQRLLDTMRHFWGERYDKKDDA